MILCELIHIVFLCLVKYTGPLQCGIIQIHSLIHDIPFQHVYHHQQIAHYLTILLTEAKCTLKQPHPTNIHLPHTVEQSRRYPRKTDQNKTKRYKINIMYKQSPLTHYLKYIYIHLLFQTGILKTHPFIYFRTTVFE